MHSGANSEVPQTPALGHRDADPRLRFHRCDGRLDLGVHALEAGRIGVTEVDDQPDCSGMMPGRLGKHSMRGVVVRPCSAA